jgi:hypothetical protein
MTSNTWRHREPASDDALLAATALLGNSRSAVELKSGRSAVRDRPCHLLTRGFSIREPPTLPQLQQRLPGDQLRELIQRRLLVIWRLLVI